MCFVIDESGSMFGSVEDVIGGFQRVIDEQKGLDAGSCQVSLFKFADEPKELYIGKDVAEVEYLNKVSYRPGGLTAMNDGIGMAIDRVGEWLNAMKEEDKPEKNLIVIMTDGQENNSKHYTSSKIREMIKHQEEKYSWTFMYLGTDVTDDKYAAVDLGIQYSGFSSRDNVASNYDCVNTVLCCYRSTDGDMSQKSLAMTEAISGACNTMTEEYENTTGIKYKNRKK